MCLAAFVVKYVLFFANAIFAIAGLALVGVGIAVLVQFGDLVEVVPAAINSIPIAVLVVGAVVFLIAVFGCCGAIRESRCLLIMYAVCMMILAAVKIYLAVVIFQNLSDIYNVVEGWIRDAFNNPNLREAFHVVEAAFQCCGVSGPSSYDGVYPALPPTCCASADAGTCAAADAFGGCANIVAAWFNTFGDAVGIVLIIVIVVELVAMIFGLFLSNRITNKKRAF
ncbi:leukocyte surface antigen CD53-like [Leguminivora glycinivorella]|uniref:leukocyte surface antigen CD53-like n=1 Tax=Leguminivora glycinivorella TaxID=1035111 RepID=UPI00200DB69D|nr:leukocyte surface antigen CD53-like [Leguminivora glycinivorella]